MELPDRSAKEVLNKSHTEGSEIPLQLQSLIRSMRTSAIIMVVISIISVYFIPWAVFYLILANKLKPEKLPSRKLVKWAAIVTLPLCLGVIPILIDIEFWRMNKHLKNYEEKGHKAFISDKEYIAGEPKRNKHKKIIRIILVSLIVIIVALIIYAFLSSSSSSTTDNSISSTQTNEKTTPYTSIEYGFKIDFLGTPEVQRDTIQEEGNSIPYTVYTKENSSGEEVYFVGVYDFSGYDIDEKAALEGGVNGGIQGTEGAKLVSSEFTTYQGLTSVDAYYTTPIEGKTYDGYMKAFIKSKIMYSVFSIGASKTEFDQFMDSFSFTQ
jgi:hypothetical protein